MNNFLIIARCASEKWKSGVRLGRRGQFLLTAFVSETNRAGQYAALSSKRKVRSRKRGAIPIRVLPENAGLLTSRAIAVFAPSFPVTSSDCRAICALADLQGLMRFFSSSLFSSLCRKVMALKATAVSYVSTIKNACRHRGRGLQQ
jgi:hypothetical protein